MKKTMVLLMVLALAGAGVRSANAGDREWATAGKILTGVVAASVLAPALEPAPCVTVHCYPPTTVVTPPPVVVVVRPQVPVVHAYGRPVWAPPPRVVVVPPPPVVVTHPPAIAVRVTHRGYWHRPPHQFGHW
jgi:hypothetical protein